MSVEVMPSARLRSATDNLAAFVHRAREDIAAFGPGLQFDMPVWDVTGVQDVRASAGHRTGRLYFTTHEGGASKSVEGRVPLVEPFASFLKALVRTREENGHVAFQIHGTLIRAGRYLYDAMATVGHHPCNLLPRHFDEAAALCRTREAESTRYRVGMHLRYIADQVNHYGLSAVRIEFKNPFPRVTPGDTRIGEAVDERRTAKMPSEAALDALALLAGKLEAPEDLLRIRAIELLVCGGWRINELLTIPADCEMTDEPFRDGNPVLAADGSRAVRYGIRYFGEKKAGPRIKWIQTHMVDVAKRAVADLRRITEPSRAVAKWMETNPGRAWLPDGWRDRWEFTAADIAEMVGLSSPGAAVQFMSGKSRRIWTSDEVEAALLARHSVTHRTSVPLSTSEYMFLMPRNWAHGTRATIHSLVGSVTDGDISDFIVGRDGVTSVFKRFDLREDDGSTIAVTSHQFRHWLNTLLQQGGMSQMEIARWSGRKDVAQNAAYDHVSGFQLAEKARELLSKGMARGPLARIAARLDPVRRADFVRSQVTTAHTTDLGMCANDWSLAPCMAHGACAKCEQHLLEKGNQEQRERARQMRDEHEALLAVAEAEASEETYGASNFVEHHKAMRDSLDQVLAVHDDPTIRDGDLIQLDLVSGHRKNLPLDESRTLAA